MSRRSRNYLLTLLVIAIVIGPMPFLIEHMPGIDYIRSLQGRHTVWWMALGMFGVGLLILPVMHLQVQALSRKEHGKAKFYKFLSVALFGSIIVIVALSLVRTSHN